MELTTIEGPSPERNDPVPGSRADSDMLGGWVFFSMSGESGTGDLENMVVDNPTFICLYLYMYIYISHIYTHTRNYIYVSIYVCI